MKPGDRIESLVVDPVPVGPMKTMAALLDDPTPIHYDAEAVRALGLGEREINQGPMNVGYLTELAARAAGGVEGVRRVRVRLLGSVFAGERLVCEATVVEADPETGLVELELSATAGERPVLSGSATISPGAYPASPRGDRGSGR